MRPAIQPLLATLLAFVFIVAVDVPNASASPDATSISAAGNTLILAQQSDTSSSSPRIRGRSIRGIIYLVVAVIGGIGWVIKKLFGGDE